MNSGEERCGVFSIARSNAAPLFKVKESIFNQMTQFIDVFVILALNFAVFSRWNHGNHALILRLNHDVVAVVTSISQQMRGI